MTWPTLQQPITTTRSTSTQPIFDPQQPTETMSGGRDESVTAWGLGWRWVEEEMGCHLGRGVGSARSWGRKKKKWKGEEKGSGLGLGSTASGGRDESELGRGDDQLLGMGDGGMGLGLVRVEEERKIKIKGRWWDWIEERVRQWEEKWNMKKKKKREEKRKEILFNWREQIKYNILV